MSADRTSHWNSAYAAKGETGVSWFEAVPEVSLALIEQFGHGPETRADRYWRRRLASGRCPARQELDACRQCSTFRRQRSIAAKARLGDAAEQVELDRR